MSPSAPVLRMLLLGQFLLAKIPHFAGPRPQVAPHGQVGVDHGQGQRPTDTLGLGQFADRGPQRLRLAGADAPSTGTAQHGRVRHQQLIAGQGDQRRVGPRFGADERDRAHLAGIETGQIPGQPHAVFRRTAGAVDRQTNEIDLLLLDLFANAAFDPVHRVRLDGARQVHANRPPAHAQRRIFLHTAGGQLQRRGQLQPIPDQVARQAVLQPQLGAREVAQLPGGDHLLDRTHRGLLLQIVQLVGQDKAHAVLRLHARNRQLRIEHPQHHRRGNRPAALCDLDVPATDRGVQRVFGQSRSTQFGIGMCDDLLASQHRQDGVSMHGAGQIGDGAHAAQLLPRQVAGQRQGSLELAGPLRGLVTAAEFQDQRGASAGVLPTREQFADHCLQACVNFSRNRRRHTDQLGGGRFGQIGLLCVGRRLAHRHRPLRPPED